jgi:carboxyl-terminal processing protease
MRPVFPRAGMSVYKETADAFIVATVLPGSPAAKAGIATGDRIVAVNDMAASQLSYWDWRRCIRQPVGTVLRLRVAHGGRERAAELTLRELLP